MKQKIISILLLLIATCSWAQDKNKSASDEKQRIPIKPIIVEGELTGVPDGTPVQFAFRAKKSQLYKNGNKTLVDTIRNGKFHIEKKFIYKDLEDSEDNIEYLLAINGCGLNIYACQGAKVKVTGTPDLHNLHWRADCDYPLQKESNEYSDFKRMIIKELDIKAPRDVESDSEEILEKVQSIRDSIYIVSKLDFMKNRECNPVFINELWDISFKAHKLGSENLSDRIRNLIKEKVQLSGKLDESTETNNELNKKVEKLENDSYWYIIFIFISIKISYDKLCTKQQHIIIYMSHFFYNK